MVRSCCKTAVYCVSSNLLARIHAHSKRRIVRGGQGNTSLDSELHQTSRDVMHHREYKSVIPLSLTAATNLIRTSRSISAESEKYVHCHKTLLEHIWQSQITFPNDKLRTYQRHTADVYLDCKRHEKCRIARLIEETLPKYMLQNPSSVFSSGELTSDHARDEREVFTSPKYIQPKVPTFNHSDWWYIIATHFICHGQNCPTTILVF